jgi:homoserine kinase type II
VLEHYPALFRTGVLSVPADLPHGGGFSGASIYRLQVPGAVFCLRGWPPADTLAQVAFRQQLMRQARDAGLGFVPALVPPGQGSAGLPWAVPHSGRLWELAEWLPGQADFWRQPSRPRLEAACQAVAQLHLAWELLAAPAAPCPSVDRRLSLIEPARQLLQESPQLHHLPQELRPDAQAGLQLLGAWLEQVPRLLAPWRSRRWPLQPCLCDVWHDHLLFSGNRLTGVVDYGAVKIDHVAVDLARMLGSLIEDDEEAWQAGLKAYREARPMHPDMEELAHVLDRTGTILALAGWLQRLSAATPAPASNEGIRRRLERLVRRMAGWGGSG